MEVIQNFLRELGLTHKEVLIYITLLKLGPQAASVISRKTHIARSSTFFHLDHLIQKGFVKREARANLQYFCAIPPDHLRHLLIRKRQRAEDHLEAFEGLLPQLKGLCPQFSTESKVSYFEGVEGICKMIDLVSMKDEPSYFILSEQLHPKIDLYIRRNYISRCREMKSKTQMIGVEGEKMRDYLEFSEEVCEWAGVLNQKKASFDLTILIQENATHFLSSHPEDLTGVLIKNPRLANTMRSIFDLIKGVTSHN